MHRLVETSESCPLFVRLGSPDRAVTCGMVPIGCDGDAPGRAVGAYTKEHVMDRSAINLAGLTDFTL